MKKQVPTHNKYQKRKHSQQKKKLHHQNNNFIDNDLIQTPLHIDILCDNQFINLTKSSLKTREQLTCSNKLCQNYVEPQKDQIIQVSVLTLCASCQQQFKNQSYCIYCKQIYFDSTDDGKQWIMCEQCERWVHSNCADFNTKQNKNITFKCIKCKTIQPGGRRNYCRSVSAKLQKKRNSQFLNSLGFTWELTPQQIAQDMELIKKCLSPT